MSFSFIVPTCGRPTLARTIGSLVEQLESGDEVLIICDKDSFWGNSSRDKGIAKASGSHLLFIDDDDCYAEGALASVRAAVNERPEAIHVFRMKSAHDNDPWNGKEIRLGNIGSPMFCVPNVPEALFLWATDGKGRRESDFDFFEQTARNFSNNVCWHEEVLALVRPD